ncbi:hypothetical protein GVN16_13155, partial [Emticicia sp. CRIBPO]|uniref:hypothetical protein n=1 Tax=Emticicia sp. CRIBPO TaxID=2683258 RepID=UPI0014126B5C
MNQTHLLFFGKSSKGFSPCYDSSHLQPQDSALPTGRKSFSFISFTLSFLLLFAMGANAQQIQSGTGAPTASFEVANGSRQFTVTVLGGTTSSGSLVVTLPTGYVYESGSATGAGGLTVTQTSVSGNTATLNLSGIPATGTNATFTYKARASCEAIGEAGNQASYVLTPSGGSAQPEILSNAFNLLNAKINILNLVNAPNTAGSVGDTYTRTYQIRNDGFGSIDTVYVTDLSGNGVAHLSHSVSTTNNGATVTVDLISSTPSGSNTTYLYRFIVSSTAQDNHLGQSEYFTFTQNLQINSCTDLNTGLNAWYGNGPNPQVCAGQNDTQTTALAIDNSKTPNLTVAFVSADDLSCAPASGWITASVTNTGTSPAMATNLRFGLGTYNAIMNPGIQNNYGNFASAWIDEADGVQISSDGGTTWSALPYTTSTTIGNAVNTDANGKPLDVIVTSLTIAPGQTIQIRFKKHIDCNSSCSLNEINFMKESLLSGSYKNSCGEGNYTLNFKDLRTYSYLRGKHVPEMGVDAVGGSPYWVQYKLNQWNITQNIWDNKLAGPGAYTEMLVNLPACLTADLSTLTLTDISGSGSVTPDMVFADAAGIHIRFNLAAGGGLDLQNKILRFKTMVDCAVACPSPQITSKIIFKQSATCPCTQVLGCSTWEPLLHCPACTLPLAIVNKESSGKRITLGLPDDNNNGSVDALGSNYPANLKTSYFTVGDQLEITATGEVAGVGSFDYAYLETTAPAQPALTLLGTTAKSVITDASTSTTYTLTGLPVSGTYPNFKTDISKAALVAAGVPATFTYEPGDKIAVTLTFDYPTTGNIIFNPDGSGHLTFNEEKTVIFKNLLYGGLAANPAPADQLACDAFSATMQHVGNNWFYGNGSRALSYNGCLPDDTGNGTYFASDINNYDSGRQQNAVFPYEINRFIQPKEFVFTLPAGLEAINTRITIYGQGGAPFVVNKATPDYITGQDYHYDLQAIINTLKGSSPSFFDEGMAIVSHPILRATCQASASGNLSNKIIYTYGTDPTVYTATNNWPYTVTSQGNLTAAATSPVKTVTGNTVSWEIQVTNTGNVAEMANVWLGRNAAGGGSVTITSVQQLPGSGAASGTAVSASGDIYQLGSIPASTSQYYLVTGTFNNCNQDNLQLAYGWNCSGYPTSVAAAVCSDDVDLTVIPTPANLQVSLLSQPVPTYPDGTVDLCQELEYIAEVKNPAQGTAFDLKFTVQKPAGVAYIANSYQLSPTILPAAASLANVNNDALVTETATSITFTIPASVAANLPYNQGYTIRYKVRTVACDFVSGTKMNLQALGNNGCGSAINGTRQQTQTVRIKGENANPNGYTISSAVPAVDACN